MDGSVAGALRGRAVPPYRRTVPASYRTHLPRSALGLCSPAAAIHLSASLLYLPIESCIELRAKNARVGLRRMPPLPAHRSRPSGAQPCGSRTSARLLKDIHTRRCMH